MDAYLKNQFDFTGVKAALLVEQSILVILRDNKPDIPWPNTWELPGGGREGNESPFECAAREVYEELGIHLTEDCMLWSKVYPSMLFADKQSVFLVGKLAQEQFDSIVFGDECKAPTSPYIIYIVGRTLGELKVLEATCGSLADAEDLACQLRGCRLVDGFSKGTLGESCEGKE